jgi:hypothetical protein
LTLSEEPCRENQTQLKADISQRIAYNFVMSQILDHAIERLRQMPEERQDSLARFMLHEMEEDERWQQSTAANAVKLQVLVRDVLSAVDQGECEPLQPDQL